MTNRRLKDESYVPTMRGRRLKYFIELFPTRMPGVAALQPARFALGLRAVFSDDSRPTFFLPQHSPNCSDWEHRVLLHSGFSH